MKIRNISEALLPRPKVNYYIDRIIRPSSRNMFWAAPGTGKSLAFITMGICYASEEIDNWLGFEIHDKGKVLFLQEEMGDDGFLEFLEETYKGFFGKGKKDIPFDFSIFSGMNFSNEKVINNLCELVEKQNYKLLLVDSFAATVSDDENSKKDIQPAMENAKKLLSLPSKPAIIFTHHPTRDKSQFRGSGAIGAAMDLIVEIKEKPGNCLEFKIEKNRYKPCFTFETKKIFDKDIHGNDTFILERTGKPSDLKEKQELMITIIENNPEHGQQELSNAYVLAGGKKSDVLSILSMLDENEITETVSDSIGGCGKKKIRKLTDAYIAERMSESLNNVIAQFSSNGHGNDGKTH